MASQSSLVHVFRPAILRFLAALVPAWVLAGCTAARAVQTAEATGTESLPTGEADTARRIDTYIEQFGSDWGEAFRFNGYVMVVRDGKPIYSRGFGKAHEDGRRFEATTVFPIASNTKGFTAAAVLRLQEQGRLRVQDRVVDHLANYDGPAAEATIHQLLTHTAGIPSYTRFDEYVNTQSRAYTVEQILELFRTRDLEFEPGEGFLYSNSGYALLGAIIEAASGSPYGEFLAAELAVPAGLASTGFVPSGRCQDELPGFSLDDAERLQLDEQNTHMSNGFSAGGVRSTASDLAAWGAALMDGRVLQASSMDALFTQEREHYAYGWEIGDAQGRRFYWHGGVICGFRNQVVLLPEERIVIVAWTNNRDFAVGTLVHGVVSLMRGEEPPAVEELELAELSQEDRDGIVGRYRITPEGRASAIEAGATETWLEMAADLVVVDQDGELYIENLGGLLSATVDGSLVVRSWRAAFSLEHDKRGHVTRMQMRVDGANIEYARAAPAHDD